MRGSRLIPILVISSLIFTSIAYACSGLRSMEMNFASTAIDNSAMERGPCNNHKHDICKFVRDQMLSVLPSSPLVEVALHISTIVQAAYFEMPFLIDLLPTGPPGVLFNPVFKSSFPFSNQVLRI